MYRTKNINTPTCASRRADHTCSVCGCANYGSALLWQHRRLEAHMPGPRSQSLSHLSGSSCSHAIMLSVNICIAGGSACPRSLPAYKCALADRMHTRTVAAAVRSCKTSVTTIGVEVEREEVIFHRVVRDNHLRCERQARNLFDLVRLILVRQADTTRCHRDD